MRIRLACALLLAGVATASHPSAVTGTITSAPAQRVDRIDIGDTLEALRAAHPDLLTVDSLGQSAAGRELWVGVAGRGEDLADRPAVLLFDYGRDGAVGGAEDSLAALGTLLELSSSDLRIERLLDQAVVYVLPALDPDRDAAAEAGTTPLDRDFPIDWAAPHREPLAGPYPLHLPEARAFARFLDARDNLAAAVTFTALFDEAEEGESDDAATASPIEGLGTRYPRLAPRRVVAEEAHPGSLLGWCRSGVGLPVLEVARPSELAGEGEELTALSASLARLVADVLAAAPRLEATAAGVENLGQGLWMVDVEIVNRGTLSTGRDGVRHRTGGDGVFAEVSGVVPRASALRRDGETDFAPLGWSDQNLELGHLGPGESVFLRLVVAGDEATSLALDVRSVRASSAFVRIELGG